MTKQPDVEHQIAEAINEFVTDRVTDMDANIFSLKAELLTIVNEAVVAELKGIQLAHGNYVTTTWINGTGQTIETRIAELTTRKDTAET